MSLLFPVFKLKDAAVTSLTVHNTVHIHAHIHTQNKNRVRTWLLFLLFYMQ